MEKEKITFKELSGALKTAIIISYTVGTLFIISFLIGFIEGILLIE